MFYLELVYPKYPRYFQEMFNVFFVLTYKMRLDVNTNIEKKTFMTEILDDYYKRNK